MLFESDHRVQKNDALVGRLIWRTLLPQFATELSLSMTSIIDGIIVGNFYGKNGLAAVGLGAPILSVFTITAGILSTGNSVICASHLGKSSNDEAGRIFSLSILWSFILSVLLTALCVGGAEEIAILFGAGKSPELLADVTDYIRGFSMGAGFILLRQLLAPMINMEGGNGFMFVSSISILSVDFIADYVSSAYLNGGTFGLGLASAISYVFGCMVFVFFYIRGRGGLHVSLFGCFSLRESLHILLEGIPTALKRLCDLITPVLTNRFILTIASVSAVATLSVQSSATRFPLCVVLSLSTTVLMLIGTFYSESDRNEMELACKKMLIHSVLWSTLVAALFFVFATPLAAFFVRDDADIIGMSAYAIRWYVVGIPFLALNQCAVFYLQAVGRRFFANTIMIADRFVSTVALVYLLGWLMGERGIYIANGISEVALTVILYIALCIRNKGIVTNIRQLLLLPDDYGVPEEDCMFALFRSKDDAIGISKDIQEFCLKKGVDKRRAYVSALCTEELAINVIDHGFTRADQQLSVRLFIRTPKEDDERHRITIRFRDNGRPFNIKERRRLIEQEPEDPTGKIGIRLVFVMAEDVSYIAAYGMNNTVIRL